MRFASVGRRVCVRPRARLRVFVCAAGTLQFAGSHFVTSLFAFNVGVELGQLLVLAILVPLMSLLFRSSCRRDRHHHRVGARRAHRVALDGRSGIDARRIRLVNRRRQRRRDASALADKSCRRGNRGRGLATLTMWRKRSTDRPSPAGFSPRRTSPSAAVTHSYRSVVADSRVRVLQRKLARF